MAESSNRNSLVKNEEFFSQSLWYDHHIGDVFAYCEQYLVTQMFISLKLFKTGMYENSSNILLWLDWFIILHMILCCSMFTMRGRWKTKTRKKKLISFFLFWSNSSHIFSWTKFHLSIHTRQLLARINKCVAYKLNTNKCIAINVVVFVAVVEAWMDMGPSIFILCLPVE